MAANKAVLTRYTNKIIRELNEAGTLTYPQETKNENERHFVCFRPVPFIFEYMIIKQFKEHRSWIGGRKYNQSVWVGGKYRDAKVIFGIIAEYFDIENLTIVTGDAINEAIISTDVAAGSLSACFRLENDNMYARLLYAHVNDMPHIPAVIVEKNGLISAHTVGAFLKLMIENLTGVNNEGNK